ncbi:alpha/beta hydrolase fold domain-containing protein [Streptomyces griseoaurantiacus]|uniref:alpha/beta hydrolase fold domain-containing protein n=1 Tax=Streptomyces griseoaurantiacus TaxID=68213 RepID=UPI00378BF06D
MSSEQLEHLKRNLREGPLDIGGPIEETRGIFEALHADLPVPESVKLSREEVGGVPALVSEAPGVVPGRTVLYLHGGAHAVGSAQAGRSLSSTLAAQAGARGIALDYRLAPEHPLPANLEDVIAAYRALLADGVEPGGIAFAGDSSGGGLALAALVAARDAGLPMPGAAVLFSPWIDLALTGASVQSKADDDPSLYRDGLLRRAADYLAGDDPCTPLANALYADLSGLPPLLIQVGSSEILLDDATRLAARAGRYDLSVQLDIWPQMPHVWQVFFPILDEGRQAVDKAAAFITTHLI